MKKFTFLLFSMLCAFQAFSQPNPEKLDKYLKSLDDAGKFMGVVAMSHDGKMVYSRAVGMADVDAAKKISENSKFRIGSISKMFTAALALKAVEENKLSLEDKLSKFFKGVPNADKITVAMMLGHRSGIFNFTDDKTYTSWLSQKKSRAEMIDLISKPASVFEPGTKASYSNANYVLLTYILEDVFKKPYAKLLEEKIAKPLKLKDTYYGGVIDVGSGEVQSYRFMGAWEKDDQTDMSIPAGAGAIVSNAEDLARFIEALFAGKIVSGESLAKMKDIRDDYGLGMFTFPYDDKTAYGHTGGIDSFRTMLAYFPEDKLTFVMLSNGSTYKNNDIGIAAMSWFYNMPFDIPEFTKYSYKTEELDQFVGNYVSSDIPLKIAVTKKGTMLFAQATGQQAFPLDGTSVNVFKFDRAGVVIEFDPANKAMKLKQGGAVYNYKIEK